MAEKKAAAKQARKTATESKTKKTNAGTKTSTGEGGRKAPSRKSVSLKPEGKDPKGGLTPAGRKQYNEATGGHLRPGIKHPAKTVEEKKRKGSFLRRHFANPPGPVVKDGEPTRQALQAAAWGEPVPRNEADERKLAEKGKKLLDEARQDSGKG